MEIRILQESDAPQFQRLRLSALRECPAAFSSSYEEECDIPLARVAERLSPTADRAVFGAFVGEELAGMVGLRRESHRKLRHKADIWGVYVAPASRKTGVGRRLLEAALHHAAAMPGLRQLTLGVNAANPAAMALYRALGFEPFGIEKGFMMIDGVLHDEVHMVRVLEAGRSG